MKKTLEEVGNTFEDEWDREKRQAACDSLDTITTGGTAWEMDITAPTPSVTGPCALTATFDGKCYKVSAINYALFGKMSKLCFGAFGRGVAGSRWSLEYSIGLAQIHKWGFRGDFGDEAKQAFAFTSYGFGSSLEYDGKDYAIEACDASKAKCKGEKYKWKWVPNKNEF